MGLRYVKSDQNVFCTVHRLDRMLSRLERELGDERSANARLKSELAHAQERLGELAASHQKLKFQVKVTGRAHFCTMPEERVILRGALVLPHT